jgi:hypothetical protein
MVDSVVDGRGWWWSTIGSVCGLWAVGCGRLRCGRCCDVWPGLEDAGMVG